MKPLQEWTLAEVQTYCLGRNLGRNKCEECPFSGKICTPKAAAIPMDWRLGGIPPKPPKYWTLEEIRNHCESVGNCGECKIESWCSYHGIPAAGCEPRMWDNRILNGVEM